MTWVNNAAHVTGKGNLNLGVEADDGAGDATQGYAKSDIRVTVPLNTIYAASGTWAMSRTSQGLYVLTETGAAATHVLVVPLGFQLQRLFAGTPAAAAPHGVKINGLELNYTIATANMTSIAVTFNAETQANNGARAITSNPFGSSVTYQNPPGTTAASLPVATQANPYVTIATPSAPIFVNTDETFIAAEISFVNPGTAVAGITGVQWMLSVALY